MRRTTNKALPLAESLRLLCQRADWQTASGFVYFEGETVLARVFSPRGQQIEHYSGIENQSGIRKLPGWAARMIIVEKA